MKMFRLLYGNQYRSQKDVRKKYVYEVDQELWGGELSLFACPGVGNRPPRNKKLANPRGMPRGHGNRSKLNHALPVYRDLNCLHGFCIKEVCNVQL